MDVRHDDIWRALLPAERKRLLGRGSRPVDGNSLLAREQDFKPVADNWMVVDNQYAYHVIFP